MKNMCNQLQYNLFYCWYTQFFTALCLLVETVFSLQKPIVANPIVKHPDIPRGGNLGAPIKWMFFHGKPQSKKPYLDDHYIIELYIIGDGHHPIHGDLYTLYIIWGTPLT